MIRPYTDYKNKMIGKRINYDHWLGYQCVDLFKDYCNRVIWKSYWKTGNAKQIWTNKYKIFDKMWTYVQGTKDLMQWDIIVSIKGTYWHVAIIDRITWWKIFVLEQNGSGKRSGNGLGPNAIRIRPYPFSFWTGIWRCEKIFQNLQLERQYINKTNKNTLDYENSIRYIFK